MIRQNHPLISFQSRLLLPSSGVSLPLYTPKQYIVADLKIGAVYFDTIGPDGNDYEYLPNGDYRILISMLKPGAASTDLAEWESWLSPVIRLLGDWRDT